jgi:hypothetical protein
MRLFRMARAAGGVEHDDHGAYLRAAGVPRKDLGVGWAKSHTRCTDHDRANGDFAHPTGLAEQRILSEWWTSKS